METSPQTVPWFISLVRARNENCDWRRYAIRGRETFLVYGQAKAPARIDIQQWLLQRHVAEGAYERDIHLVLADSDVYCPASRIAEFKKVIAADIGDQIPERSVGRNYFSA